MTATYTEGVPDDLDGDCPHSHCDCCGCCCCLCDHCAEHACTGIVGPAMYHRGTLRHIRDVEPADGGML